MQREESKQLKTKNTIEKPSMRSKSEATSVVAQKNQTEGQSSYNLREKKRTAENSLCPPAKRPRTQIVARIEPIAKFKSASRDELVLDQVVLAKMKSYQPWPAILKTFRPSCVEVHFFGDETTGTVPYDGIGFFENNIQLIISNLRKNIRGYEKAVRTAELLLGVNSELSILNKI